jgi:hypothetical protein
MIGWRPYLLTLLALALIAVVVLDVVAASRGPSSCAKADGLRNAGLYTEADKEYAAVLRDDAKSGCAAKGRSQVGVGQCTRLRPIIAADAAEGRKQVLRFTEADPKPRRDSCLWGLLTDLPPAGGSTR